jgi:macrolide transport system ATP-binding/permease protein
MSWLPGDLKYALRGMARRRGFTLVAVLSLALGIGANATIFTLLNGILLRPLAVDSPASLVAVYTTDPKTSGNLPVSYLNYKDYRDRNSVFSNLALYTPVAVNLTGMGDPRPLMAHIVSGNYFQTLGVKPIVGRAFLPEEDGTPNAHAVAVISYGLWSRLFASDPQVMSRTLMLSGRAFSIVGVAPEDFHGINELYAADLWTPMAMYPLVYPAPAWVNQRRASVFSVIGRLKRGVGMARAEGAMQSLAAEFARQYPRENGGRSVELAPVAEAALSAKNRAVYSRTGSILLAISGIVLLIACANVANLLLARAAGRAKEITLRIAVGASRWHLVRQLLVESVLLSAMGGAVGLLAAQFARGLLWPLRPPTMKYAAFRFDPDVRVLGYTLGIALLTGIVFGLLPAFGSRADLAASLKERAGSAPPSGGAWPPRSLLVILQLAFSLVALLGAGLFLRSVQSAIKIDPGFDGAHLGVITFNVADQGYNEARGREYRRRILERAAAVPGVESAGIAKDLPFSVGGTRNVLLQGEENAAGGRPTLTSVAYPGFFQTVRIPVLSGRDFSLTDSSTSPRVAIVNDSAARHFWPGEDAVGKVIQFAGENLPVQIVGVVRTAAYQMPGEAPQAMVYLSTEQYYFPYAVLYVRAARDPAATLGAVLRELRPIDPNLFLDPQTVDAAMRKTLWAQNLSAMLLTVFGVMALLLSSIGIYGVTSFGISLRVREIGVRMALGAEPRHVRSMLMREGAILVAVGIASGLAGAFALSRVLETMLVGVGARDVATFVAAPCVLAVVALAACWLPARKATRIDPGNALRAE